MFKKMRGLNLSVLSTTFIVAAFLVGGFFINAEAVFAVDEAPTVTGINTATTGTIIYTFNEEVKLTSQADPSINPDKSEYKNLLGIFEIIEGGYNLSTQTKVRIDSADLQGNILTIKYSGTLEKTSDTSYIVDAWGYNITDLAGNKIVQNPETQVFTIKAEAPKLSEKSYIGNTITYTFNEPVQLVKQDTDPDKAVATAFDEKFLGIYSVDSTYNYGEKEKVDISATLNSNVLKVTYTGNLEKKENTNYIIDAWGYDITDMSGNKISKEELAGALFEVKAEAPTAVATTPVDDSAKIIKYTFSEPVQLIKQDTLAVTPVSAGLLGIYPIAGADYNKDAKIAVASANLNGNVLTVTYTETLPSASYIVDAWGYNITDIAGNKIVATPSQIFTVTAAPSVSADLTNIWFGQTPNNYTFAGGTYTYNDVTFPNYLNGTSIGVTGAGVITMSAGGDAPETITSDIPSSVVYFTAGVKKIITVTTKEEGKLSKIYTIEITKGLPPPAPVVTTKAQTVNTDTINIIGTATANSNVAITGGATDAKGTATAGRDFNIVVTLKHNTVNTLSVVEKDKMSNPGAATTVVIKHDNIAPTAAVSHNETLKTITYTFNEDMQIKDKDGSGIEGTIASKLDVYQVTGSDYATTSKVVGIKITEATLVGKVLTITYEGTLVNQKDVKYIVDAWNSNISDLAGNKMLPADSVMFTVTGVDTIAPTITAVNANTTGTIVYTFNEAVKLTTNDDKDISFDGKLAIYGTDDTGTYGLDTITSNTINSAVLSGNILTIKYDGSLVKNADAKYVVDAWGYKITDLVGNRMAPALNQIFTITGDKTAPTATVAYSTTTPTNSDVVATIKPNEEIIGDLTHTFKENGSYIFNFTDLVGNKGSIEAKVSNINRSLPVITILGTNPISIAIGSSYVDQGATAVDVKNVELKVTSNGTVDTNKEGTYTITYTTKDSAGNIATATRTVDVYRRSNGGGSSYKAPIIPTTEIKEGCVAGNIFNTLTGKACLSTSTGQVLGAESFNFTLLLKKGSTGNEVMELQKFLNAAGYDCGIADGKFGAKTKAAVIKFQIANGLIGDGIVGAATRAILNK